MRIAVDYQSTFGRRTGIGNTTLELVRAMKNEAPDIEFLLYGSENESELNTPSRVWRENVTIPRRAHEDRVDLIYVPGFSPALSCRIPQIVTVHDLIGLAMPGNQRAFSASRFYWTFWLPRAIRHARRIAVPSAATCRDLQRYLNIAEERISVVPWGAAETFRKIEDPARIRRTLEKFSLSEPFLLAASSLEPRKNHLRLLQACLALKEAGVFSFTVVIAGKDAGEGASLKRFVQQQGLGDRIRFLGYVDDEDLVCLYNGSVGYVMISLYEGFGLPVLEAMRCGKSGVIAAGTSLPEVAGDTALAVDPLSIDSIARALCDFTANETLRRELEAGAYARSRNFSYQNAATRMIGIFRDAQKK